MKVTDSAKGDDLALSVHICHYEVRLLHQVATAIKFSRTLKPLPRSARHYLASILMGWKLAGSLRGSRERQRRASRSAPAQAGRETLCPLPLAELVGAATIILRLSTGSRRHYKPCS